MYDGEGNRIFERELPQDIALDIIELAQQQGEGEGEIGGRK